MALISKAKEKIASLLVELHTMALVFTDKRTPWYVKIILICLFLYAASPIDIIPDFIPILGMLDDLIIISLGLKLAMKLTPEEVINDCREHAKSTQEELSIIQIWKRIRGKPY